MAVPNAETVDPNQKSLLNINMSNITKLTSTNYFMWSTQVHALFDGYELADYLDGSKPPPSTTVVVNLESQIWSLHSGNGKTNWYSMVSLEQSLKSFSQLSLSTKHQPTSGNPLQTPTLNPLAIMSSNSSCNWTCGPRTPKRLIHICKAPLHDLIS